MHIPRTPSSLPRFLTALVLVLFALIHPAPAQTPEVPAEVGLISVPANLALSDVSQTIQSALIGRQWTVKEVGDHKITAYLKHRSNEAELSFIFDIKEIRISCWGYKLNLSTGARRKPEIPEGWVNNLKKDISQGLGLVYSQKVQTSTGRR